MKKKMLFILPMAVVCFAGAGVTTVQVKAEGEDTTTIVEETPVEEETPIEEETPNESIIDWDKIKEELDKAQAQVNKVKEYTIFGTTIGAILGTLISLLASYAFKRIGQKNIENACATAEESKQHLEECSRDMKETLDKAEKIINQLENQNIENKELNNALKDANKLITDLKGKNDLLEKDLTNLKDIVLKLAYSNKDLVKSGVANDLHEKYDK